MKKLCECGCGQKIVFKWWHKYQIPRFIDRHQNRGENHPMYGKHPSKKTLDKKSKAMKGRHLSEEHKRKISDNHADTSGKNSAMWKGGITLNNVCNNCGKPLANYKATYCMDCYDHSGENNGMYGVHRYGEDNPNWQGGLSFEPYPITFNNQLKDKIRARDNFICQLCGVPELECNRRLTCHHIDYDKKNCKENNLLSLCCGCNTKVNTRRRYWINYFQERICQKF